MSVTVCTVLILTRRVGENIVIGDDIVISVLEVRGDAVRIGIQAPRSVTVHREEVYRELQRANQAAARSGSATDEVVAAAARRAKAPRDGDVPAQDPGREQPQDPGDPERSQ